MGEHEEANVVTERWGHVAYDIYKWPATPLNPISMVGYIHYTSTVPKDRTAQALCCYDGIECSCS